MTNFNVIFYDVVSQVQGQEPRNIAINSTLVLSRIIYCTIIVTKK